MKPNKEPFLDLDQNGSFAEYFMHLLPVLP